jgi:hypothetical protein
VEKPLILRSKYPRFAHFSPNLLKSLDGSFAKLVTDPRQFIDFKGLKKMVEPSMEVVSSKMEILKAYFPAAFFLLLVNTGVGRICSDPAK